VVLPRLVFATTNMNLTDNTEKREWTTAIHAAVEGSKQCISGPSSPARTPIPPPQRQQVATDASATTTHANIPPSSEPNDTVDDSNT
jgi:hypothetical protein